MTDAQDHRATLTERFTPTENSIRWEVQVISHDKPWTTAISTRLNYPATEESRVWTSWGDPDDKTGVWQDPLVWRPFADRSWSYQFSHFTQVLGKAPVWICLPLATLAETNVDIVLTLVQSPEDPLLDLKLAVTKKGTIELARTQHRLGEGRTVRFAMDLVAHPADCRAGLGWMVKRYPACFNPPNPRARDGRLRRLFGQRGALRCGEAAEDGVSHQLEVQRGVSLDGSVPAADGRPAGPLDPRSG